MEFRILGPLEAWDDQGHPIALGGTKQRALLAELLIHANQVVSSDHLVQALWGEEAPGTARKALQVHVSQLRKVPPPRARWLLTRPPGYLIAGRAPTSSTSPRFERVVESQGTAPQEGGRERLLQPRHPSARALALWRGPPLDRPDA